MKMTYWTDAGGVKWAQKVHWAISGHGNIVYAFSSAGNYITEDALAHFNRQIPYTRFKSIDEVFYRYGGNYATQVCKNSHLTVATNRTVCDFCGVELHKLQIINKLTKKRANISGYLSSNDYAVLTDDEDNPVSQNYFLMKYKIKVVEDESLLVARLFDRHVITG